MATRKFIQIPYVIAGMAEINQRKADIKQIVSLLSPHLAKVAEHEMSKGRLISYPYGYPWGNVDSIISAWIGGRSLSFQVGVAQEDGALRLHLSYGVGMDLRYYRAGEFTLMEKAIGSKIFRGISPTSEGLAREDVFPCYNLLEKFVQEFFRGERISAACKQGLFEELSFFHLIGGGQRIDPLRSKFVDGRFA